MNNLATIPLLAALVLGAHAAPFAVSPAGAQDTLRLAELQDAAIARDPRGEQARWLRAASELRLTTLDKERLPQMSLNGQAAHQNEVTKLAITLPNASVPTPPKDRWQATMDVQQVIYDAGSVEARRAVERARLAESEAAVDVALYRLRADVNAAFFAAFILQERAHELDATLGDFDARLAVARARVVNGAALGRDSLAILAERLRVEVARDEALASRGAALAILTRLTGRAIGDGAYLALPDLSRDIAAGRTAGATPPEAYRLRPEFSQFARTRERLDREAAATRVENRPRIVAFGQGGMGRPGFNQFRTTPDEVWQAGVKLEWRPFTWGNAARTSEALRMQQRIVETEERALADQLARATESDLADMRRLEATMATDDRLVAIRAEIERQGQAQFNEGAITAAEYVELRTDVLEARLTLQRHRAELAQAQARYLTTLGLGHAKGGR